MHDENKQRERIIKWFDAECQAALLSEYPQVKRFSESCKINKETSTNKALRK